MSNQSFIEYMTAVMGGVSSFSLENQHYKIDILNKSPDAPVVVTPVPSPSAPADTTPPALITTGANEPTINGDTAVLHFDDQSALDTNSTQGFSLKKYTAEAVNHLTIESVVVNSAAKTITIKATSRIAAGDNMRVQYYYQGVPTYGLQDIAGNLAANFEYPLRNITP